MYGTEVPDKPAFTKNISPSGLRFNTTRVYPPGTRLILQVHLPHDVVETWAKVTWAQQVPAHLAHVIDGGMGLQLEDPPEEWLAFCAELQESDEPES